jgi:integrase
MAPAHDGTAHQGGPGGAQVRFHDPPGRKRYLHLCWQASENGRELEPLKHRQAGDVRDVPVPDMVWDMVQALPDGPLCPGPNGTPYMPYSTARNRFGAIVEHQGISGAHTHSLRHQFASEALDEAPPRATEHQPGTRPRFG